MIIFPFQHYFFFFLELISVAFSLLSLYIYHEVIPKASPSSVNFLTFYQCHHLQEVFPVAPSLLLLRSAGHLSLSMPGSSVVLSLGSGAFFLPHPQLVYAIILHSSPLSRKGHLFWVLILEVLIGLYRFNFGFFSITGWGVDLDYYDLEWFAQETNRGHSVIFESASKYCISDSC